MFVLNTSQPASRDCNFLIKQIFLKVFIFSYYILKAILHDFAKTLEHICKLISNILFYIFFEMGQAGALSA